jgi:general secretion pathway protein B
VVKAGGEARQQAAQPGAKNQGAGTDQQAGKVAKAGKAPGKKPGKAAGTAAGKDPETDSAAPAPQLSRTAKAAQKKPAQKKPKPEVIGYWELPPKARNQLPEMRISVLVYAERPEDRFLLMNGNRYGEGDKIADELVLQEIRRDGAVMKFRLYRFLVTQG